MSLLPARSFVTLAKELESAFKASNILDYSGEASSLTDGLAITRTLREQAAQVPLFFMESGYVRRQSLRAQSTGQPAPLYVRDNIFWLIHWPSVLEDAYFYEADETTEHHGLSKAIAHLLLRHYHEIFDDADHILGEDVRYFHLKDPESTYLVAPNETAKHRFDAHLRAFLKDSTAMKHLARCLNASFKECYAPAELHRHDRCPEKHHNFKPVTCPDCIERAWLRSVSTSINIRAFETKYGNRRLERCGPFTTEIVNPWHREVRYILSGFSEHDGITLFGNGKRHGTVVLVDFAKLLENAIALNRDTPFRSFIGLQDPKGVDYERAGAAIRAAFVEKYKRAWITKDVAEYVVARGGTWHGGQAHALFNAPVLTQYLKNYMSRYTAALDWHRRRAHTTVQAAPRKFRVVYFTYENAAGESFPILATRRRINKQEQMLFTLPVDLAPAELTPYARRRACYFIDDQYYWTLQGIGRLAEVGPQGHVDDYESRRGHIRRGSGPLIDSTTRFYPWVRHFADWVLTKVDMTREEFRQKLFDESLDQRVLALKQGKRKHLSFFTTQEDTIIREVCGARKPGKLTAEDWHKLTAIPRSRVAILKRMSELAYEYAEAHGWPAYVNSGYRIRHDESRRKKWLKQLRVG